MHAMHLNLLLFVCTRYFALREREIKLKSRMHVLEFVCVFVKGMCVCVCGGGGVRVCVHECVYSVRVCVRVITHTLYNADWQEPGVWHFPAWSLTELTSDTMS